MTNGLTLCRSCLDVYVTSPAIACDACLTWLAEADDDDDLPSWSPFLTEAGAEVARDIRHLAEFGA